MAAVTDEELEEKRQRLEKLREQVASEEDKRVEHAAEAQRAVHAARLDAEAARLEAQLEAAKVQSKVAFSKEAASGPLEQAKEQMRAAQQTPPTVAPIQTNPDDQNEKE